MAGSRLSEARRCFALLALILLMITLFGSHLPWMEINEPDYIHTWDLTEKTEGETGDGSGTVTFYMTEYFNLLSVESCQTFIQGADPFYFSGQVVCSVMSFSDATRNTVDVLDWNIYTDSCESAGLTAFILVLTSVALLCLVVAIATFKNVQRKCCPKMYESQHGKAKCMVPACAAFAPLCGIIAILLYFVQCINNVKGTEVVNGGAADVARTATGYQGFWIALAGTVCLLFWWILFTVWFCGKKAGSASFNDAGDPGTRSDSVRTQAQKQPIIDDSEDEEEENSRMELASHQI